MHLMWSSTPSKTFLTTEGSFEQWKSVMALEIVAGFLLQEH